MAPALSMIVKGVRVRGSCPARNGPRECDVLSNRISRSSGKSCVGMVTCRWPESFA